jgi:hypothetical protein
MALAPAGAYAVRRSLPRSALGENFRRVCAMARRIRCTVVRMDLCRGGNAWRTLKMRSQAG